MLRKYFINQALKEVQIEEFIRNRFPEANYSHMELKRTPLGIKIIIFSSSPGRIIGKGGRTINEMTDALKEKFNLENPQLDVKSVAQPFLDAKIVAKQIALAMERGFNFKRVGNTTLKRVMAAGAMGVEISIGGRVSGGKAMRAKFIDGYLKHSGDPSKKLVDYGFEEIYQIGRSKPGKVGIKVKIMKEFQSITGEKFTKATMPGPGPKPKPEESQKEEPVAEGAEKNAEKGAEKNAEKGAEKNAEKSAEKKDAPKESPKAHKKKKGEKS